MMQTPYISLVIPVLNESGNLPILYRNLVRELKNFRFEIIFVNDGSSDDSINIIKELYRRDRRVKLINLSRNFGHQMAITCGLDFVNGDVTIIMDADLQDPPALIDKMLKYYKQGYDVVYGIRIQRKGESMFKTLSATLFYQTLNLLSPVKMPTNVGDFRLLSRRVVNVLTQTREYHRFVRGIVSWAGFKQIGVAYIRQQRLYGRSKYSFITMVKLALDALFSFTIFPLRIASIIGVLTAVGAFFYVMYAVFMNFQGNTVRGWSSLVVVMLLLGSVQLLSLGIIGEYLGKTYEEVKHRKLYIVESFVGFPKTRDVKE